ncbi:fumarylacetoacetate hydrolase family protein [Pseudarthrobacter sulfonivorans]|uniref:fumarylacetoacetate hydrolase family protein n=1 Tax=Pseudarthrobacter sulfonivorans TaxID=121292 RepID=UPI002785D1E9|nr:fumarylacetoacetate hydrolase family protein [Pseudarthrobacter sulfonivorans]MDP9998337.1 2-keto-4-pentenoate hydratase/2-oxohepta-3-ene-1,7-dioic acid hydratase in catechol pathway [Pseudarthrobacter sulfonivorans]
MTGCPAAARPGSGSTTHRQDRPPHPEETDISKAAISTTLNGEVEQKSDLSHLIFSIPTLIATISEFTTLEPGDVILTGTPSGVGYRRDPQLFLKDGDTITVTVEGVGSITNTVRAESRCRCS